MAKALFRKAPGMGGCMVLAPAEEAAEEALHALRMGAEVMVEFRAPRNVKQHKLFFALLNKVIEGGGWEGDVESLLVAVKVRLGYVSHIDCGAYGARIVPKSIAFGSMDQASFRSFFDRAAHLLLTQDMGLSDEARAEIIDALEAPYRDPREQEAA